MPLGFATEAEYTARYANEVVRAAVDPASLERLKKEGEQSRPVVALTVRLIIDAPPDELERNAERDLANARMVLGWVAGSYPEPFALVTTTIDQVYFKILPPHARRRQRLGFGNTGPDYYSQLYRILSLMESDERFAFAVSLFRDALREDTPEFRVARFFSCLEALAYRIKKGLGSRSAVRKLLGLPDGALSSFQIEGVNVQYDRVELAGRIRDKLFHGVPFVSAELTPDVQKAYQYLREHPEIMRDELHMDCELEIARWPNNASIGQQ